MSRENVTLVQDLYDGFRRADVPAVLALLDPDVEYRQSTEVPWGGEYRGHAGVMEFFQKLTSNIESQVTAERYVDAGDQVVFVGFTRGRAKATGKTFDVPAVHVWTIRKGKAVRFEAYIDHPSMVPALS